MGRPCGGMSIDFGSLWVADCPENAVKRIDIKTGKLLAVISTGFANQQEGELNTVTGAGSAWVGSDASGKVARIAPATNKVAATIAVAPGTWYLSFGLGALFGHAVEPFRHLGFAGGQPFQRLLGLIRVTCRLPCAAFSIGQGAATSLSGCARRLHCSLGGRDAGLQTVD